MKKSTAIAITLLLWGCISIAQDSLLAYYPLLSDAQDATGRNEDIELINTPFENGGIYSNGIYINGIDPNGSMALSPQIEGFDFDQFTISADFQVSENLMQPVFVGGTGCRWIAFYLWPDGNVMLRYNNGEGVPTTQPYSLDQWHNAKVSYDGTTARLFLDDVFVCSVDAELNNEICGEDDSRIGVTDFANGFTLKGYFKEFKIFGPPPSGAGETAGEAFSIFPNPAGTTLFIDGLEENSTYCIFDNTGKMIMTDLAGSDRIDIGDLAPGIYAIRIRKDREVLSRKFVRQ